MKTVIYPDLVGEMAKHGETQKFLAKELGLTNTALSRRLAGKKDFSITEIEKICEHYGKTYYELFRRNN